MQKIKFQRFLKLINALLVLIIIQSSPVCASINFTFSELFSAEWGENETSVGFRKSFDKNYGPSDFFITNSGKIFILDSINKKIKRFDENDSVLVSLPIVLPAETFLNFIVDETQNFVYALNIEN
ncbi:hypothetical protein KA977_08150 [Candidatus Dependentiae bacterium]|nr:hypothetical protein [Candidatus Dependentiae bacterium]